MTTHRENAETTAYLCLQLLRSLGAEKLTPHDIDIAHRVPPRIPNDRPRAIIVK